SKAALTDRGESLKKQEEKIKQQKEETQLIKKEIDALAKDNITNKELIEKKQLELLEKQNVLNETSIQLNKMTEEAERLEIRNKLLEKDKKIKELEVIRQRLQKYFILSLLAVFLFIAIVLFKQFKSKQRTAIELAEKNEIITNEKKRSDELLLNILPLETANELKINGKATAREYEMVTVMFTDFKDFTTMSEKMSPIDLVGEIDTCYCAFDNIIEKHGIEKIKTIGDAYLCAYGIAQNIPKGHVHNPSPVIDAAFEIVEFMQEMVKKRALEGNSYFRIRVGIHSGPLVAGVVGRKKFAYDIWGDTVNTAARMEQHGEPDKINVSAITYKMVESKYDFTHRGKIEAKNKGNIDMYFADSKKS
ncbi:MAG: adenylate/guanylate cyclase domain-containing protein, partial [Bacteroidia bacterium]